MLNEKPGGTAEELRKAALVCLEKARTLRRPVLWDISQVWSLKNLMPPDDLLARVDELKAAAGKAAEECGRLLGPFKARLAAMRDEPVTIGRVKAASWHEAALKVAQKASGWDLGTAAITAYFKSRLDPESEKLRPRRSETAATDVDTELHHFMAMVDHDADEMEARLDIEAASLGDGRPDAGVRLTELQAKIKKALSERGPLKSDPLARAVHREPSGGFRGEVANMVRLRLITKTPDGYEDVA
jgi:hypothetical protein